MKEMDPQIKVRQDKQFVFSAGPRRIGKEPHHIRLTTQIADQSPCLVAEGESADPSLSHDRSNDTAHRRETRRGSRVRSSRLFDASYSYVIPRSDGLHDRNHAVFPRCQHEPLVWPAIPENPGRMRAVILLLCIVDDFLV